MTTDLAHWTPRPAPARVTLTGRYVRLEPLDADRHAPALFRAAATADREDRFRWLFESPPESEAEVRDWARAAAARDDPLFFAVIDLDTGLAAGRQAMMRTDRANGVTEIGSIYWGPGLSRRRGATEALYLFMAYAFDDLGYRRFEWKCNDLNEPSKRAALRFGFTFEGVFRQHMVMKGQNRDTAWFAVIDRDWPDLRRRYQDWLDPANFTPAGTQIRPLGIVRA